MIFIYILLGAAALLVAAAATVSVFFFRIAFCRLKPGKHGAITTKRMEGSDPWALYAGKIKEACAWLRAQALTNVSITSFDGITLSARYLPAAHPKGTVVFMHGYHGSCDSDFACILPFYHRLGYSLLLPDQRAHGKSEGKYLSLGVLEHRDCLEWVNFINREMNGGSIFLHGISMGGATVLMAAGLSLPFNVKGIIADCGFTSPRDILLHVLHTLFRLPSFPFIQIQEICVRTIAHFSLRGASAAEAMRLCTIPILFVHGKKDSFVPYRMGQECYDACAAPKRMISVEEAGHGVSYLVEPERCECELAAFLEDCLSGAISLSR